MAKTVIAQDSVLWNWMSGMDKEKMEANNDLAIEALQSGRAGLSQDDIQRYRTILGTSKSGGARDQNDA